MKKYHCYSANFDKKTEELFKDAEFLGQGNNGVVYSLPENKIIKIFVEEKVCKDESKTLAKTKGSKFFPKLYKRGQFYVVREKVEGIELHKYIKRNGLSVKVSKNLYEICKEFKRIGFSKIDTRCKDIIVKEDESIMMIDPKKCFSRKVDFPRHLMKGLMKLGVLDEFYKHLYKIDKKKCKEWKNKFDKYWEKEKLKTKYLIDNLDD